MAAISRMERRLQLWRLGGAVLGVLFGLWGFVPVAGAEMTETFRGLGGTLGGATTAAPGGTDGVVVAMPADDLLALAVTPATGGVTLAEANTVDAVAPLPGILVAAQGDPPPGPPRPIRPRVPAPKPKPKPSPKK
jgi:hypothetical protein